MKNNYNLNVKEVINKYNSNSKTGLSSTKVSELLELNGPNELVKSKKRNLFLKFIDQLADFMILILFAASLISVFTGDIAEGILIITIVLLNAILGVFQEAKAEKSLEAIEDLSSPHIVVIRDGEESIIDVKELVVGDVVKLKAGDFVPADLRIIESINLQIDESALTGEAVPVIKHVEALHDEEIPLGDRVNLAYMSTVVTYGRGLGIVTQVGMDTEIGKIAKLLDETKSEMTPLQKNINSLGKVLALIALAITGTIFVIDVVENIIVNGSVTFEGVKDSFTFAVALAVAAIPEGLPAIITVVLSLGMSKLVKEKAIMKNLPSVETLGSTSVICSDKTGTLTLNQMTVKKLYINNKIYETNEDLKIDKNITNLITNFILSSDAKIEERDGTIIRFGDPTELALIDLGLMYNLDKETLEKANKRVFEYPFDSERKLMSTINIIDGKKYLITKGAPDVLFSLASNDTSSFDEANIELAKDALRVLAIGIKEISDDIDYEKLLPNELEKDLEILGLVGMIDPERPEAKDAIALCHNAGITTIMITGDHKVTATAIAKNIGIVKSDDDLVISGLELDQMNDEEFIKKLEHIKVYARVSPENKVRIVEAWKSLNKVVAMTGDGVNDAPSIKRADIGIAMGITGTEVAKGASDMVLTDDNFATIVNAVGVGRSIFDNIKKAIHYLLSCNVGEILAMLLGVTIGVFIFKDSNFDNHILTAVQLLWVNLVTDSLMALALGMEHREPDIMNQQPRDASESMFANGLGKRIAYHGVMIGLLTFSAFLIGWFFPGKLDKITSARTLAFMVLAVSQLFHAFNVRSEKHSIFKLKVNKHMIYAFFISLFLQIIILLTPFTRAMFNIGIPNITQIIIIFALSIVPVIIIETQKLIYKKLNK